MAEISAAITSLNAVASTGIHLPTAQPISITDFSLDANCSMAPTIFPDLSLAQQSFHTSAEEYILLHQFYHLIV